MRSDPDGYTLLVSPAGPYTTNKLIFSSTSYDPQRAFAPVSIVAGAPLVLVVPIRRRRSSRFDELLRIRARQSREVELFGAGVRRGRAISRWNC